MSKVWAVVRREFLERVRTKWFLISTILGPLFMLALMVVPGLLATRTGRGSRIALVDEQSGTLAGRLEAQLAGGGRFRLEIVPATRESRARIADSLTREVQAERLEGFLAVSAATLEAGIVQYRGRNVASIRDMSLLEGGVRQALMVERLARRGVDPAVVQEARSRIRLETLRITRRGATGETGEATFFLAYVVAFVLYMAIILYSVNVMRSVLEEKQSRVIELLVSSLKPFQLLLGKVIGVGAVGLLQFGIWAGTALALLRYRTQLLGLLGVSPEAATRIQLPALGAGMVLVCIGYFLLGYLLYSAMFAVIGASVNTDAEAQQAQIPVMTLLVLSILTFPAVLNEPAGELALALAVIPFSSPIIMPIRYAAAEVPGDQIALSVAILAATTLFVVWLASRIYRVGILMYGKRPTLRELVRWARQS